MRKSDSEWKEQLTDEQFRVTRRGATERPFAGAYWNHVGNGTYRCVCCRQPLFEFAAKFDSGTGWPSFTRPSAEEAVEAREDRSLFMRRTEVLCRRCGAHLGHVFPDGPGPGGLRYCINSASLDFQSDG